MSRGDFVVDNAAAAAQSRKKVVLTWAARYAQGALMPRVSRSGLFSSLLFSSLLFCSGGDCYGSTGAATGNRARR
jgi:hypothetical protein